MSNYYIYSFKFIYLYWYDREDRRVELSQRWDVTNDKLIESDDLIKFKSSTQTLESSHGDEGKLECDDVWRRAHMLRAWSRQNFACSVLYLILNQFFALSDWMIVILSKVWVHFILLFWDLCACLSQFHYKHLGSAHLQVLANISLKTT